MGLLGNLTTAQIVEQVRRKYGAREGQGSEDQRGTHENIYHNHANRGVRWTYGWYGGSRTRVDLRMSAVARSSDVFAISAKAAQAL